MRSARRQFGVALAAVAATLLACAGLAGPAAAHGPTGTMGIEVVPGATPLTADVRVLLEYANDREVVPGATVVGTATGPDGQTVAPTPLADKGSGVYEVTLPLPVPGTWAVSVTAADPVAAAEATVTVRAAPSTTAGPLDQPVLQPKDDVVSSSNGSDGSDDGPSAALLAVIAVVLVAGAGVAFTRVRRR